VSGATDALRTGLRGVGQSLITLGVIVLLFCVYGLWVTNLVTAQAQNRLDEQLQQTWSEPVRPPVSATAVETPQTPQTPQTPELGSAFARLHVPSLPDYDPWNVVAGVTVADLKNGPGHIPGTALPGEVGNVVLSGHRTTYGAPFNRWGDLLPGSVVVLETRDQWFTYTVTGSRIVAPDAIEVTLPVPGDARATPTKRLLTMTTCHPKYSARQRLIVSAELTATKDKVDGLPTALAAEN